ncbi:MAG: hypothetical protein R3C68_17660 [Myxococcota bacterium]
MPFLAVSLALTIGAADVVSEIPEEDIWRAVGWTLAMSKHERGPYDGVAWYCADGVILPPKSYACRDHGGGVQYGVLGKQARRLGDWGIYVGTNLAALKPEDLTQTSYYRARALVVERYLERALDGWVLHTAKTYRGFRQIEDERAAAGTLLVDIMRDPDLFDKRRALAIRLIRTTPYGRDSALADEIRAFAGRIGDADKNFASLRYKIHSMPEPMDIEGVAAYAQRTAGEWGEQAKELAAMMRQHYSPASRLDRLKSVRTRLKSSAARRAIDVFLAAQSRDMPAMVNAGVALLERASRELLPGRRLSEGEQNVMLLQVMGLVEEMWLPLGAELARAPISRRHGIELTLLMLQSARFVGMISKREADSAAAALRCHVTWDNSAVCRKCGRLRRVIDWGRARVLGDYGIAMQRYAAVEPGSADGR